MKNEIAITDDLKAVERWENEGGKVSLNSLWASLKKLETRNFTKQRLRKWVLGMPNQLVPPPRKKRRRKDDPTSRSSFGS